MGYGSSRTLNGKQNDLRPLGRLSLIFVQDCNHDMDDILHRHYKYDRDLEPLPPLMEYEVHGEGNKGRKWYQAPVNVE